MDYNLITTVCLFVNSIFYNICVIAISEFDNLNVTTVIWCSCHSTNKELMMVTRVPSRLARVVFCV